MTRKSDPNKEAEFELLAKQLEALFSILDNPALAAFAPAIVARQMRATLGLATAIKGAKMAISDGLEMLEHATLEERNLVNARLLAAGCPPLHVLQAGRAKVVRRILRQRQLNSESEYYLLKEVVLNQASSLTEEQMDLADSMLDAFERSAGGAV